MAKFTLHNENGDFMHDSSSTLTSAINKAKKVLYKCIVYQTYKAPSPWNPTKVTEHGKQVFKNF